MQTKVCTKCHEEKEISEFYKLKNGKYGVESVCKFCKKSPGAKRDYLVPNGFKLCKSCDKEKPLSDFYKDKNCSTGTDSICKICDKEIYRESRKIARKKYKNQDINRALQRDYGITLNDYTQNV
jgi:superfamily II helicase